MFFVAWLLVHTPMTNTEISIDSSQLARQLWHHVPLSKWLKSLFLEAPLRRNFGYIGCSFCLCQNFPIVEIVLGWFLFFHIFIWSVHCLLLLCYILPFSLGFMKMWKHLTTNRKSGFSEINHSWLTLLICPAHTHTHTCSSQNDGTTITFILLFMLPCEFTPFLQACFWGRITFPAFQWFPMQIFKLGPFTLSH